MLDKDTVVGLLVAHVLGEGETVSAIVDTDPETLLVTTSQRRFAVESQTSEWLVGRPDWVAEVVVATRQDLRSAGRLERFLIVVPVDDETPVLVNDSAALAELGRRVPRELDPVAFAELLVQFATPSTLISNLLLDVDDLRLLFGLPDLPDVDPFEVENTEGQTTIRFASCTRYRPPGSLPVVDLHDWTVVVGRDIPAAWRSELAVAAIPLG